MGHTGGEYHLAPSTGPAVEQLVDPALQGRSVMHRHPWLPPLLLTRPSLGPNSLRYLEHARGAFSAQGPATPASPCSTKSTARGQRLVVH